MQAVEVDVWRSLCEAYWKAAVQHHWPLEQRLKAPEGFFERAAGAGDEAGGARQQGAERAGERAAQGAAGWPNAAGLPDGDGWPRELQRVAWPRGEGDGVRCGVAKKKGYRSSERNFEHQLCRKCYMDWRKHLFKMRRSCVGE